MAGRLGVSIGLCHAHGPSLTQMLSCADEALYAAKAAGRNRFRIFDEGLRGRRRLRRDSERDLSHALAEKRPRGLVPADLRRGRRARRRPRGPGALEPPGPRLDPAGRDRRRRARAGLTESLLRFILEQVCGAMLALRAGGVADVRVAMNVSPREMAQVPVDEIVLERLRALGLPPPSSRSRSPRRPPSTSRRCRTSSPPSPVPGSASRSTISASATRRWRACASCGPAGSRSTAASSPACRPPTTSAGWSRPCSASAGRSASRWSPRASRPPTTSRPCGPWAARSCRATISAAGPRRPGAPAGPGLPPRCRLRVRRLRVAPPGRRI